MTDTIRPIPRLVLPEAAPIERSQAAITVTAALGRCRPLADSPRQPPWLADRARTLANALEAFLADLERVK